MDAEEWKQGFFVVCEMESRGSLSRFECFVSGRHFPSLSLRAYLRAGAKKEQTGTDGVLSCTDVPFCLQQRILKRRGASPIDVHC